jgi:hypothetical protein
MPPWLPIFVTSLTIKSRDMKTNNTTILNKYFEREMNLVQNNTARGQMKESVIRKITHYPASFEQKTSLVFKLEEPSLVSLVVYNPEFHCISYLHCGFKAAGYHRVEFDGGHLPAGNYVARLRTQEGIYKEYMRKVSGPTIEA